MSDEFAADFGQMDWNDFARIRRSERDLLFLAAAIEEHRHEKGLTSQEALPRSHQSPHKARLLLRAVTEYGFHLDAVFHVHHPARFRYGRLAGIKLHFHILHIVAEYLVIHFVHCWHSAPPFVQYNIIYDLPVTYDVVILGGGAAGLMCAIEAAKRNRSVIVLERNASVGKKIRISGGGRCNFTNLHTAPENFITGNPQFHKSALARYTPEDFVRLVRNHRIAYHEKKLGQLFCDGMSQQIIDMLLKECENAGVTIRTNCIVRAIRKDDTFVVNSEGDIECQSLVVATGGLSIPKLGASDLGYRIARQFGLRLAETRPALVPLTLSGDEGMSLAQLSGLSFEATVSLGRVSFRENVLFTHRGLSGPAILQISSYWKPGDSILIEPRTMPRRFVQKWRDLYGIRPMAEWTIVPSRTEGYARAEVTAGGVDTHDLSSKTMEAVHVPGLYFVGEVVDVTGWLGGFNFQWAWASGFVAGQYV